MAKLSKEAIIETGRNLARKDIDVPEWGGELTIKELNGSERDAYEASLMRYDSKAGNFVPDMVNGRARLVAMCIVDEGGSRMFNDTEVLALGGTSAKGLDKVYEACKALSGLDDDDDESETVKVANFESASESSTTD